MKSNLVFRFGGKSLLISDKMSSELQRNGIFFSFRCAGFSGQHHNGGAASASILHSDFGILHLGVFQICWVICRIMHAFVDVAQVSEANGIERPQSGC